MKNLLHRVLSVICCALIALTTLAAHAAEETITIGTEPTFPPFEFVDSKSGEITGFDIELMQAIAQDQGFDIKVISLGFDGLIPAVISQKIDMAASGFTITDQRAKVISFSEPYIDAGIGIVKRTENDQINSVADLAGKTAAVQIGTSGQKAAEDLKAKGQLKSIVVMDNSALAITDLLKGRVDVVINDIPVNTAYLKKSKGELTMLDVPLNKEQYGFVINKKNPELLQKVNAGLAAARANGTYDKIYDKYFNTGE